MAKLSQLDKVLANLRNQRDVLDKAIAKIEAEQGKKPAPKKPIHIARLDGASGQTA